MSTLDEKGLGHRLQEVRRQKGFTQQTLCQSASLSYSTLAKIERGAIKSPSIFTVQSIAVALGVSLDELLGTGQAADNRTYRRSKSGVSFVYFDVNDTLVRAAQRGFTLLAERSGILPDVIEMTFWHYNDALNRGTMSLSDFDDILSKRVGMAVDWRETYLEAAEPIVATQELLTWAAEYYRVGLMTNTLPGLVAGLRDRQVLPNVAYAAIIDSSQSGVAKPETEAYQLAQERAGVPVSELLLVDDSRANIVAAEQLGWHVARFDGYRADESAARIRADLEPAE